MLVKEAMHRKVVTFGENDTLKHVLKQFVKYHISGAPVVKGKKVIGIVSESDVIKAIDAYSPKIVYDSDTSFAVVLAFLREDERDEFDEIKKEIKKSGDIPVKEFMKKKVKTIGPDKTIIDAVRIMNKFGIKRIPVVDKGRLVGIISRADVIKVLGK